MLDELAAPGRPPITGPVLLVVAHPDDETIGCGAQLRRFRELTIVHATDGAPARWRPEGFASREAYAAARVAETEAALAAGGVDAEWVRLGIGDQEVTFGVVELAERLRVLVAARQPRAVLTHAYEGGHPDHDAVALAVRIAAGREGVIEMPYYHREGSALVTGRFLPREGAPETVLTLDAEERARKGAMLAAHRSQAAVLTQFGTAEERFRAAPATQFLQPPHERPLWYERQDWGVDWPAWRRHAARAILSGLAA